MADGADEGVPMAGPAELRIKLDRPAYVYPMFEQALRIAAGESADGHLRRIGELWSQFSGVAAKNPHAWSREPLAPHQIWQPSPRNRMISWPYTKLMNSNNMVDQGAALVLTSVENATYLQIPSERWVFPYAGTDSHDTYAIGERAEFYRSPGDQDRRAAGTATGRHRRRRSRPDRRLLVLPVRGAGRRQRVGPAGRRPEPAADGDRRPDLRRRAVEQLRHPFDRHNGRTPGRQPRPARIHHRQRRVPDQAQLRRLRHGAARATSSVGKTCNPTSTANRPAMP